MTAAPDDVPDFRLFTSAQAAYLVNGGESVGDPGALTKATFDALARSGQVKHTRIRRKIRWTYAQIAAAVAYHETAGTEEAKVSASAPRESRTPPAQHRGAPAPFVAKPGSRYAAAR